MISITKCAKCDSLTLSSSVLCKPHWDRVEENMERAAKPAGQTRGLPCETYPMPYAFFMPDHLDTGTHVMVPADLRTLDGVPPEYREALRAKMEHMLYGLAIVEIPDQAGILQHNDPSLKTMGAMIPKDLYDEVKREPVPGCMVRIPIRT